MAVTPLGAGRHVGRSCILLEIGGRRVLFDCGISPGKQAGDPEHLPELRAIVEQGTSITEYLDVVVISHCHTDHVAALPYLTEELGYRGPLLMSHPTRAISPIVCKDSLRLSQRGNGRGQSRFRAEDVDACFERATCMQLRERVLVKDIAITSYYAGHVLGAIMVLVECRGRSALYTGDFTMVPDHYISAAKLPLGLRPDVMVTETTCCTTIRSSKRSKEIDLCRKIEAALESGGKVLMPIFMIGRAQEMCMLCEKHWERAQLDYPIYMMRGNAEVALEFFRLFPSWSSDSVRKSDDPFNFKYVKLCDIDDIIESNEPMVIFAGPAMLQGGASLRFFRKIAPDKKNLLVFSGYCLPGTLGNEVQAKLKTVKVDGGVSVDVRCGVEYMSHSDHTDSRGITQLIAEAAPKRVVLVHGAEKLMDVFRPIVERRLGISCFAPGVGETVEVEGQSDGGREVLVSPAVLLRARPVQPPPQPLIRKSEALPPPCAEFSGVLLRRKRGAQEAFELRDRDDPALSARGAKLHRIRFRISPRSVPLPALRGAWEPLRLELLQRGLPHRWTPREPALADTWGASVLVLLEGARCELRPAGAAAEVFLEWAREDEDACPALADFADALQAV